MRKRYVFYYQFQKMPGFAERASTLTQQAMVGMGLSLAYETGIIHALADASEPLTSLQVAQSKGLKERYVRELLNSLATVELVQVERRDNGVLVYSLEAGAKDELDSEVGPGPFLLFPSLMGHVYSSIKPCVYVGGPNGVRYDDELQEMLDKIAIQMSPSKMSMFLDNIPQLKESLESGIDVIEFGSGRARLSATFAERFPNSSFVASECVPKLVEENKTCWSHIPNLSFSLDDLCDLPEKPDKKYDWVFCVDVVHDLPNPLKALTGVRQLLKGPESLFSFLDICTKGSPIADKGDLQVSCYYAAGSFLCIPESYQREDSIALGPCWGRQAALDLARSAGFDDVSDIDSGNKHAIYICKNSK